MTTRSASCWMDYGEFGKKRLVINFATVCCFKNACSRWLHDQNIQVHELGRQESEHVCPACKNTDANLPLAVANRVGFIATMFYWLFITLTKLSVVSRCVSCHFVGMVIKKGLFHRWTNMLFCANVISWCYSCQTTTTSALTPSNVCVSTG